MRCGRLPGCTIQHLAAARLDREKVLADGDVLREIELCGDAAVLAIAQERAVQPAAKCRVDTLKDQREMATGHVAVDGDAEAEAVAACGVGAGNEGGGSLQMGT